MCDLLSQMSKTDCITNNMLLEGIGVFVKCAEYIFMQHNYLY